MFCQFVTPSFIFSERLPATSALNHNWIINRSQNKNTIEHQKLKRFLAQRKWRVSLHANNLPGLFIREISNNNFISSWY